MMLGLTASTEPLHGTLSQSIIKRPKAILIFRGIGGSRWRTWHVSVLVKSENGRLVVDDVRLLGDGCLDGPSRLLTDQFIGCEGPRWVGDGSTMR
jgi:hypothetical protein